MKRETWLDSDGLERTPNEWGFNSFATAEGAEQSARTLGNRGSTWYIWQLADGTYAFTAVPDPSSPGHPSELVETITLGRRTHRRTPAAVSSRTTGFGTKRTTEG